MPSFNTSCVNNSNVQRTCPAGGSLQAKAIMCASCFSSSSEPVAGCGLSSKAACNPSWANRSRVRRMVCSLTYSIRLISASVLPSSTFSKMCARWITTALLRPFEMIARSFFRSASVRWTSCFSFVIRPSYPTT